MIKQNEIKVLLMANVHGGNLHHILYADTEILSAISWIILSMARLPNTILPILFCRLLLQMTDLLTTQKQHLRHIRRRNSICDLRDIGHKPAPKTPAPM